MRLQIVSWAIASIFVLCGSSCSKPSLSGEPKAPPLTPVNRGTGRVRDVPATACPTARAPATPPGGSSSDQCRTDAECTEGRNGRCLRVTNTSGHGPAYDATQCNYDGCTTDADCSSSPHQMCICGRTADTEVGRGHFCAGGDCTTDADCGGEGKYCRRSPNGRHCHTAEDECVEETNCGAGKVCGRNPRTGVHRCEDEGEIVGARTPPNVQRTAGS